MPLQIIRQDITELDVDAIVNTTNRDMIGYSGVDMLVHEKAGKELDEACESIYPLEFGQAKITDGFNLKARYIIHTSGPVWHGGDSGEHTLLKSCYTQSLILAKRKGCETVAFPLISSGFYGYPKDRVLGVAVDTIKEFLDDNDMMVYLCVYDKTSYEFSKILFSDISSYIDSFGITDENISKRSIVESKTEKIKPSLFRSSKANKKAAGSAPLPPPEPMPMMMCSMAEPAENNLSDYLKNMDKGFADTLFFFIDSKNMSDVECYKKANIDKKTFSKIKCNKNYKPSKNTALALAIALQLDMDETERLLNTVGMSLSRSNTFDLIIRYFIEHKKYDIFEINEALFEFDQTLLGSA